ncbi:MAG: hypothetical protein M1816_006823 [Peltula sp. TS41687]|nr:MAG: hypothetical protein M1816_006823 [Peltula sp. TS41687]
MVELMEHDSNSSTRNGQGKLAPWAYFCNTKLSIGEWKRSLESWGAFSAPCEVVWLDGRPTQVRFQWTTTRPASTRRRHGGCLSDTNHPAPGYLSDGSPQENGLELALSSALLFIWASWLQLPPGIDHSVVAVSLHDHSLVVADSQRLGLEHFCHRGRAGRGRSLGPVGQTLTTAMIRWLSSWNVKGGSDPIRIPSWAHFPGLAGRTLMAKFADTVHTWRFKPFGRAGHAPGMEGRGGCRTSIRQGPSH